MIAAPTTASGRGLVLTVMCAAMFLVLLDVTIVNVALPAIARGLRAEVAQLQWVVAGYVLAIAGLLLAAGTIGDRFGHRRMLLAGSAVFGAASLAGALAPRVGVLIGARVLQGVGGALLLPSTMAVIVEVFPGRAEQAKALGTWAAVSSLALPAGPLLGSVLVTHFGWRPVFWIAVPLTIAAALAARIVAPADAPHRGGHIDLPGLAGFVVGLSALIFAIISAGHHGGLPLVLTATAVAISALAASLVRARRGTDPFLPVDLLRRKEFLAPNAVALLMNLIFNGILFVGMLYLQDTLGRSPIADRGGAGGGAPRRAAGASGAVVRAAHRAIWAATGDRGRLPPGGLRICRADRTRRLRRNRVAAGRLHRARVWRRAGHHLGGGGHRPGYPGTTFRIGDRGVRYRSSDRNRLWCSDIRRRCGRTHRAGIPRRHPPAGAGSAIAWVVAALITIYAVDRSPRPATAVTVTEPAR